MSQLGVPSVEKVQANIQEFEHRFKVLKKTTQEGLDSRKINVEKVVECLTELPADDMSEHMVFLKREVDKLLRVKSLLALFLKLNFYWNYLAYHLLEHLIKEFSVEEVKEEMQKYKSDLKQFMMDTPLDVFCKTQERDAVKLPPGFN